MAKKAAKKGDGGDTEKVRLNLDLSPRDAKLLDECCGMHPQGKTSKVEAIRTALKVYKIALDIMANGGKVILKPKDGEEERLVFL